jgi:hypothetical protein
VLDGLKYVRGDVLLFSLVPLYLIPMLTQNTCNNFLPIFARDILKIGKGKGGNNLEEYLDSADREPGNSKGPLETGQIS